MKGNGFIKKRTMAMKLDTWLPRLACPDCKFDLRFESSYLECNRCKRKFQISRGIPILLPYELRDVMQSDEGKWMEFCAQVEGRYIDLDGDTFRQKMLETSKESHCSGIKDAFFWEKRLFRNIKDPIILKKDSFRILRERNNRLILSKLRSRLNLQNKVVLNIGPGMNTDMINLLEDEGAEVMNCDLIEDSLQYLSGEGKELLTAGDIRNLPFQPRTFDLVLAMDVLHHAHPVSVPLKEIYRVLREGGIVCLAELNRLNSIAFLNNIFPRFLRRLQRKLLRRILKADSRPCLSSPYERILSSAEVTMGFEDASFVGIEASVLNYVPPVSSPVLRNFLESVANCFPRLFTPIAFRYFFTALKGKV